MKFLWMVVGAVLVIAIVAGGGYWWWQRVNRPAAPGAEEMILFVIPKGQSAGEVGKRLTEAGVVKSRLAFKLVLSLSGRAGEIQAGEYRLSPAKSLSAVIAQLLAGPEDVWVTFPEGWRKEQVAMRLVASLGLEGEERQRFLAEFLAGAKEGYLFPDTYLIPRDATAAKVLTIFGGNFDRRVSEDLRQRGEEEGRGVEEIVIMASLIERETRTEAERPLVAGILWKRLAAGWPLQADASLQYAKASKECGKKVESCEDWWPEIEVVEKEVNSGYNTYRRRGLPVTAIANPGLASIEAAVLPVASDYWFYLHDGEGKIHFAKTAEEHAANVVRYLK